MCCGQEKEQEVTMNKGKRKNHMHVHLVASLFRLMTVPLLSLARFNDLKSSFF